MKLFFTDGRKKGDEFELSSPGASIGRELDNDIILEGEGESRYHSKLELDGKDWKIKDLGSTNGTKLNGTKLTPNELVLLKEGDNIVIGKQTILFAEKLPEKVEDVIPMDKKEDTEKATEEKTDDKKEEAPSIVAIKPPSPMDETISETDPLEEKKSDEKSSKSFSDFFGRKDEEKSSDTNGYTESIDFFGNTKQNVSEVNNNKEGKKKHAGLLFYVAVLGTAVILIALFLIVKTNKPPSDAQTTATVKKRTGAPLLIRYEKQVTTTSPKHNVFRYLMEIKDGKVSITIDDVRAKYKTPKLTREVSEEQIQELEDKIRETDFMETEQPQIGISSGEEDKVQELTIAYGKEMNSITVKNIPPPSSFLKTTIALEDFSRDVLNIPPVSLTPEERQGAGISAYRKAKQLYDNYHAKEENLYNAIKFFGIATQNLEGFQHLPEYEKAYKYKVEAELILKKELKQHESNYTRYLHLKNYTEAKEECLSVMAKIEPRSKSYKLAKKRLIQVENEIRKKRR